MIRAGTFFSGLTTMVVLAVPVLAGLGLLAFGAVYESGHYLGLLAYGLLALGALLGYRAIKAKAGPAGLELEADQYPRSSWTSETVTIRPEDAGDLEIVDHYRSKDKDDADS